MRLEKVMEKATPGPVRVFEHLRTDSMNVVSEDGRGWTHTERAMVAGTNTLIARVFGNDGGAHGYPYATQEQTLYNAVLIAHWMEHGPKLLAALIAADGNGVDDSPAVWGMISDTINGAQEVKGI